MSTVLENVKLSTTSMSDLREYTRVFLKKNLFRKKTGKPEDKAFYESLEILLNLVRHYLRIIDAFNDENAGLEEKIRDNISALKELSQKKQKIKTAINGLTTLTIGDLRDLYEKGEMLPQMNLNPQVRTVYIDYLFEILQREIMLTLEEAEAAQLFAAKANEENGFVVPELTVRNIKISILEKTNEAAFEELDNLGNIACLATRTNDKRLNKVAAAYKEQKAFIDAIYDYINGISSSSAKDVTCDTTYQRLLHTADGLTSKLEEPVGISFEKTWASITGKPYIDSLLPYQFASDIFTAFNKELTKLRPRLLENNQTSNRECPSENGRNCFKYNGIPRIMPEPSSASEKTRK